jgi:hypothetical protein
MHLALFVTVFSCLERLIVLALVVSRKWWKFEEAA